jgi:hypothetical protein
VAETLVRFTVKLRECCRYVLGERLAKDDPEAAAVLEAC